MKSLTTSWNSSLLRTLFLSIKLTLSLAVLSPRGVLAQELPTLTENMPYAEARELLREAGWQASHSYYSPARIERLNSIEKSIITEFGFTELVGCPQTNQEVCVFRFNTAEGRQLTITTANSSEGNQPWIVNWELEGTEIEISQSLPILHQGKPYAEVRSILIGAGWKPIAQSHSSPYDRNISDELGYEELVTCSGTGLGWCSFEFSAQNGQKLGVTTVGGREMLLDSWSIEEGVELQPNIRSNVGKAHSI